MRNEKETRSDYFGLRAVPGAIWALGVGSLFMDTSSELIHSLLPVFLVTVLGASATSVGLIEGTAEATASITKIFSGALSDYLGKRKFLVVLGYGLAALTKPIFPLATSPAGVLVARFVDRIGKGIRGAPRDALVSDIAPSHVRGAAYGLRQSLDTVGAFMGPLLAIALMSITADDYRLVFWIAVVPAVLAVLVLVLGIEDRPLAGPRVLHSPIQGAVFRKLGPAYWWVVAVASTFALARFSEAFLVLRAAEVGLRVTFVPLVLIAMNVVYTLSAYPAGHLSDRLSRWGMLGIGFGALIGADVVLALSSNIGGVLIGAGIWGLHMGFSQGVFSALVADTTPADLRGTAFGLFNLAGGVATLLASLLAGLLWDLLGSSITFLAGAGLTTCASLGVLALRGRGRFGRDSRGRGA
jgi:MFS family permease